MVRQPGFRFSVFLCVALLCAGAVPAQEKTPPAPPAGERQLEPGPEKPIPNAIEAARKDREEKHRAAVEAQRKEAEEKAEQTRSVPRQLPTLDRTTDRKLEQARLLLERKRLAEAVRLIGSLLEQPSNGFAAPPDEEKFDPTNRTTVRRLAESLYRELPEEGRDLYAVQFEPQAKRLLDLAVAQGSLDQLKTVVRRFGLTASGRDARFLLGLAQFGQGDCAAALLTLQHLTATDLTATDTKVADASEKAEPYEPSLSLTVIACQLRLGLDAEAQATAERFWRRFPNPKIDRPNGRPWMPADAAEIVGAVREIQEKSTPDSARWLEMVGWLLPGGTPWQTADRHAGMPILERNWIVPTSSNASVGSNVRLVAQMVGAMRDLAVIPAARPLLAGEALILRGYDETFAVDARTGKRLWCVREEELKLPQVIENSGGFVKSRQQEYFTPRPFVVRTMFWHDQVYNSLSSDGRYVYQIDGLDFLPQTMFGRNVGGNNIRGVSFEDPRFRAGTTLTARDVRTGRIAWQTGKLPYTRKFFEELAERIVEEQRKKQTGSQTKKSPPPAATPGGTVPGQDTEQPDKPAARQAARPAAEPFKPSTILSEEEEFLGSQSFLGAPLPIRGRLYAMAEGDGVIRLLVFDARNGALLEHVPIIEPQLSIDSDFARRYYGTMPSASQGILVCPTSAGAVAAIDATTCEPLWCFSYALNDVQEEENGIGARRRDLRYIQVGGGTNDELARLFQFAGWQVPATMIDGNRVLLAPADRPALYCLDLLSGRLLWKNEEMKRDGTLFLACIRKDKAYVVTPSSVVAIDMNTGKPLGDDAGLRTDGGLADRSRNDFSRQRLFQPRPVSKAQRSTEILEGMLRPEAENRDDGNALSLPKNVLPAGTGIHDGPRYYLPLSDGSVLLINLDGNRIEDRWAAIGPERVGAGDSRLGNLLARQGAFYSVSPLQATAFDQLDALRERTRERLDARPNDPEALIDQARIARFEGDIAGAMELFQRSLQQRRSARGILFYRNLLLQAMRDDFMHYRSRIDELQSLALTPEDLGEAFLVYAEGARRAADMPRYVDTLEKMIRLDYNTSLLVQADPKRRTRLSRLIGEQVAADRQPAFRESLRPVVERVLHDIETGGGLPLTGLFSGNGPSGTTVTGGGKDSQGTAQDTAFQGEISFNRGIAFDDARSLGGGFSFGEDLLAASDAAGNDPTLRDGLRFLDYFGSQGIAGTMRERLIGYCAKNDHLLALEALSALPRQWFDSGFDTGAVHPTLTTEKEDGGDSAPDSRTVSDPAISLPPDWDGAFRLAASLDKEGRLRDAHHIYRTLERHAAPDRREAMREVLAEPRFDALRTPHRWPTEHVEGEERPPKQGESAPTVTVRRRGWAASPFGRAYEYTIPFVGGYNAFFSTCGFVLADSAGGRQTLVCNDRLGNEMWRLDLPEGEATHVRYGFDGTDQTTLVDTQCYVRAIDHLLLFVRGRQMVAINTLDTDFSGVPKSLWQRTAASPLGACFLAYAPSLRHLYTPNYFGFDLGNTSSPHRFTDSLIHLSRKAICFQDDNQLTAIDPLTGETLWERTTESLRQSLAGDEEHLFVLLPETNEVAALDLGSGIERERCKLPTTGKIVHVFETHVVLLDEESRSNGFVLSTFDLRDMLKRRPARELALKLSADPTRLGVSRFHVRKVRSELDARSLVRFAHYGRLVASLTPRDGGNTLRVYDLIEGREISRPTRLPAVDPNPDDHRVMDLDIEWIDNDMLVLFVENRHVAGTPNEEDRAAQGARDTVRRQQLRGVPSRGVGIGTLMLYDLDGKPKWERPVEIERWYQLCNQPAGLPVMIFGFLGEVPQAPGKGRMNAAPYFLTAIKLIDKKTGKELFSHMIEPTREEWKRNGPINNFRVSADEDAQEILLRSREQDYAYAFKFLRESPPQPSPPESDVPDFESPEPESAAPARTERQGERPRNATMLPAPLRDGPVGDAAAGQPEKREFKFEFKVELPLFVPVPRVVPPKP